jgi:hypothetical protein
MSGGDGPMQGDRYEHADGTSEVVYLTESGQVLTFREYPSVDAFETALTDATYRGVLEEVAALPGLEAFEDLDLPDPADGEENDG